MSETGRTQFLGSGALLLLSCIILGCDATSSTSGKPPIYVSKTPEQSVSKSKVAADFLEHFATPNFFQEKLDETCGKKGSKYFVLGHLPFSRLCILLRKFQEVP